MTSGFRPMGYTNHGYEYKWHFASSIKRKLPVRITQYIGKFRIYVVSVMLYFQFRTFKSVPSIQTILVLFLIKGDYINTHMIVLLNLLCNTMLYLREGTYLSPQG